MANQSAPKRHHFVPRFLLQHFTDGDGALFVARKEGVKVNTWRASPEAVFFEKHLYSEISEDGMRDVTLEHAYSTMESSANGLVQRFLDAAKSGIDPVLTPEDRRNWDLFFYQQMKRVPEMLSKLDVMRKFSDRLLDAIPELQKRLGRVLTHAETANLTDPASMARIKQNATVRALADPGARVQNILSNMGLEIGVADKPIAFVIGSQPVVRAGLGVAQLMNNPKEQMCFPISSNVLIRPVINHKGCTLVSISPEAAQRINIYSFAQSSMIAGASADLIQEVQRGVSKPEEA